MSHPACGSLEHIPKIGIDRLFTDWVHVVSPRVGS
jgi:hypothetical protein